MLAAIYSRKSTEQSVADEQKSGQHAKARQGFDILVVPSISRHDATHELIKEGYGEGRIAVVRAPNHALGDNSAAHRSERRDLAA